MYKIFRIHAAGEREKVYEGVEIASREKACKLIPYAPYTEWEIHGPDGNITYISQGAEGIKSVTAR